MTRSTVPTVHCNSDDGLCVEWDVDHYKVSTHSVGGVKITQTTRAPGWVSTDHEDYCPEHANEVTR